MVNSCSIAWCICLARQKHEETSLFSRLMTRDTQLERQDTRLERHVTRFVRRESGLTWEVSYIWQVLYIHIPTQSIKLEEEDTMEWRERGGRMRRGKLEHWEKTVKGELKIEKGGWRTGREEREERRKKEGVREAVSFCILTSNVSIVLGHHSMLNRSHHRGLFAEDVRLPCLGSKNPPMVFCCH